MRRRERRSHLVRVLLRNHVPQLGLEEQVAGQAKDAAQSLRTRDARHERGGAALAEAAEDDAVRGDAGCDLFGDERVEVRLGAFDAGLVLIGLKLVE